MAGSDNSGFTAKPASIRTQYDSHRKELINLYRQEDDNGGAPSNDLLHQLWRRYIYDKNLYAMPVPDITGRFRDATAHFYRDNPAQIDRLLPWINRDVVCLLRNTPHNVIDVLQLIKDFLPMENIIAPRFRRRLVPFFGARTGHFVHELFNFACSPFDMLNYDQAVHYESNIPVEILSKSPSLSTATCNNIQNRPNEDIAVLDCINSKDAKAEPEPNAEVASISTCTSISDHISLINSSRNSSNECVFVLERKPPHLRTPELVSLKSESDSDVVFVDEVISDIKAKEGNGGTVNNQCHVGVQTEKDVLMSASAYVHKLSFPRSELPL